MKHSLITKLKSSLTWRLGIPKRMLYLLSLNLLRISRPTLPKVNNSPNISNVSADQSDFKIVIVTFSKRFFTNCLPLIKELRASGVNQEIYIGINGDDGVSYDPSLRTKFLQEISVVPNVNPVSFGSFQGLSLIWNRCIQAADSEIVIVLNDDLIVERDYVIATLDKMAEVAKSHGICLLNSGWSHFAISTKVFQEIGWFDERLLGIGEEDSDLTFRYEDFYGISCFENSIHEKGLIHDSSSVFDSNLAKGKGKYSLFNWVYIELKYNFGKGAVSGMFERPATKQFVEVSQYPNFDWNKSLSIYRSEKDREVIEKALNEKLGLLGDKK
jgi:hypothetical protein